MAIFRVVCCALALAATARAAPDAEHEPWNFEGHNQTADGLTSLHRGLAAKTIKLPGRIYARNYLAYVDTPGTYPGPYVPGGIGYILRGEAVTYRVSVDKAHVFSVKYSLAAKTAANPYVFLVAGTSCYNRRLAPTTGGKVNTGSWKKYDDYAADGNIYLSKGTHTLTVCFANDGYNFGGLRLTRSDGPGPGPAAVKTYPKADGGGCYKRAVWESVDGEVRLNGKAFHIKGANWFGFDTYKHNLYGLDKQSIGNVLDVLKMRGINALRIPISLQLALSPWQQANGCGYVDGVGTCPDSGLSWDVLNRLFGEAALRGMLIVLDMHNLEPEQNIANELWYNDKYSEADFIKGWNAVLRRFKSKPALMAIDLFNEPHGAASWGLGRKKTDWGLSATRIINAVHKAHPDYSGLFFVEGIWHNAPSVYTKPNQFDHWWGGNLDGLYDHPIKLSGALVKKLVYAPHVYGPDVYEFQGFFLSSKFPENMPAIWDVQLGFIERVTYGRAAVIGEWGGSYTGQDEVLQNWLSGYLVNHCMSDNFFWAVNPESSDTGGLLYDDMQSVNTDKFSLLRKLQPNPSKFTRPLASNRFCVSWGSYANPACAKA